MKIGNITGGVGAAIFISSLFVSMKASNILSLLGIALMMIAAWVGSRKWLFAVAGIVAIVLFMFLVLSKRD